jgi:hypothetical protein
MTVKKSAVKIGDVYGKLTVISFNPIRDKDGQRRWKALSKKWA